MARAVNPHPSGSSHSIGGRRRRVDSESFRLLVDAVREYAIFMLTPEGVVETWNAGAQRIKGYRAEEIIGRHFSTFYPDEDIASGKPDWELEVAARDGQFEDEGWRLRKDGTRFWANVVITALVDERGELRGFTKVTRDLTDRKRAEEARVRFIANAAHELRTPLSVLVGMLSFLKGASHDTDPAMLEEYIGTLSRQADRMHTLVNNLLDLAKLEQAVRTVPQSPMRLDQSLDRAATAIPRPERIKIDCAVDGFTVLADQRGLEQVFTNLFVNAFRYGGDNITVSAHPDGDWVVVEFSDDGPGVEASLRDHLFEAFRRGRDTANEGSGLGLAIVKGFVESYGGTVALDPSFAGAKFVIRLRKG